MRKRVAVLFIILPVIVIALTLFLYFYPDQHESKKDTGHLVAVNEIERLLERGDVEEASEKLFGLEEKLRENDEAVKRDMRILVVGGICTVSLLIAGIFVFVTVLHPLKSISKFSSEIAKGNLDIPLRYERGSEVGEFSWAFDSMRIELRKARASKIIRRSSQHFPTISRRRSLRSEPTRKVWKRIWTVLPRSVLCIFLPS